MISIKIKRSEILQIMVPVGNKAKCLSLAKTFAKTIHQSLIMQTLFFVWTMRFAWVEALNYFQNVIL